VEDEQRKPVPAEPLDYALPDVNRRPWLVTAVAVVCICAAGLGMAFNSTIVAQGVNLMRQGASMLTQYQTSPWLTSPTAPAARGAPIPEQANRALKPAEIAAFLQYADQSLQQHSSHGPLTAAQRKTLSGQLSVNGQTMIDPNISYSSTAMGISQLIRVLGNRGKYVVITIIHGNRVWPFSERLDDDGNATIRNFSRPVPMGTFPAMPVNMTPFIAQAQQTRARGRMLIGVAAVLILLAGLLLLGGNLILAGNRRGVPILWTYVGLKIAICGAAAVSVLMAMQGLSAPLSNGDMILPPWIGIAPTVALGVVLLLNVFRDSPVGIKFGSWQRAPRPMMALGIISLCMAMLSLLVTGYAGFLGLVVIALSNRSPILLAAPIAYVIPTLLLLLGASFAFQGEKIAITLHWSYACLKILSFCIAGLLLFQLPGAGWDVLILALIELAYPVILICGLIVAGVNGDKPVVVEQLPPGLL
jgi:hypothetical protein